MIKACAYDRYQSLKTSAKTELLKAAYPEISNTNLACVLIKTAELEIIIDLLDDMLVKKIVQVSVDKPHIQIRFESEEALVKLWQELEFSSYHVVRWVGKGNLIGKNPSYNETQIIDRVFFNISTNIGHLKLLEGGFDQVFLTEAIACSKKKVSKLLDGSLTALNLIADIEIERAQVWWELDNKKN